MSDNFTEREIEIWNKAVIACSNVARNFHGNLRSSLFELLIRRSVLAIGEAIAIDILDLAKRLPDDVR